MKVNYSSNYLPLPFYILWVKSNVSLKARSHFRGILSRLYKLKHWNSATLKWVKLTFSTFRFLITLTWFCYNHFSLLNLLSFVMCPLIQSLLLGELFVIGIKFAVEKTWLTLAKRYISKAGKFVKTLFYSRGFINIICSQNKSKTTLFSAVILLSLSKIIPFCYSGCHLIFSNKQNGFYDVYEPLGT